MVVDALSAPTDEVYHQRLSRLPITISRTTTRDTDGRVIVTTEYRLRGQLKARRFAPANAAEPSAPTRSDDSEAGQMLEGSPDAAPSVQLSREREATDFCEYTDDENTHWSGDCATQQDIDDAYAVAISMESDASGAQGEADQDIDYCHQVLNECWETDHNNASMNFIGGPSSAGPCAMHRCPQIAEARTEFADSRPNDGAHDPASGSPTACSRSSR